MVEVNSNAILVEPIKNRKSNELQRVYLVLLDRIKAAGIAPKKHVLDNECSDNMKKLVCETYQLKFVQSYYHCRNVAEVAIKHFKAHFISILASVDSYYPRQATPTGKAHHQSSAVSQCKSKIVSIRISFRPF